MRKGVKQSKQDHLMNLRKTSLAPARDKKAYESSFVELVVISYDYAYAWIAPMKYLLGLIFCFDHVFPLLSGAVQTWNF